MSLYRYKNLSLATKTFYGVTFKPGEEKDVPGFINDLKFVRVPNLSKKPNVDSVKKLDNTKVKSKNLVTQGGKIDGADTDK